MGERINPDRTITLDRKWFARIWNGEKTIEYRERKPCWNNAFAAWESKNTGRFVEFKIGMMPNGPRLLVQVNRVDIGPIKDEDKAKIETVYDKSQKKDVVRSQYYGWDDDYWRLHFQIVGYYMKDGGTYMPLLEVPRMKEFPHGKKQVVRSLEERA